jgi:hypothetical protein
MSSPGNEAAGVQVTEAVDVVSGWIWRWRVLEKSLLKMATAASTRLLAGVGGVVVWNEDITCMSVNRLNGTLNYNL